MKYSYILKSEERILRPVVMDDAEFIVKVRNQKKVLGRINDSFTEIEKQRMWLADYLQRENEYYWIIETPDHRPYGTASLYNYDAEKRQMESGRWVKMVDAPVTNMFAERVQGNDFAFGVLGLRRLVFDVVATNRRVLQWHRLCGAIETGGEKEKFVIQGRSIDVVWFEETLESWRKVRPMMCELAGVDPNRPYGTIERIMV